MWPTTAGPIRSAVAGTVNIVDHSIFDFRVGTNPPQAVVKYELNTSGTARHYKGTAGWANYSGEWRLTGLSSAYDVRFTSTSGDPPNLGDALGTWWNLVTTRYFGLQTVGFQDLIGDVLVEIRPAGGGANLDTATISIEADRESFQ